MAIKSSASAPSLRVTRDIAADPTSTALLLAGPSAMELWPDLRRLGFVDGLVRAQAKVSDQTAEILIRAEPPRRLPTSFVTSFGFTPTEEGQAAVPATDGTLTLHYSEKDGEVATHAILELAPRSADPAHIPAQSTSPTPAASQPVKPASAAGQAANAANQAVFRDIGLQAERFLDNLQSTAELRSTAA